MGERDGTLRVVIDAYGTDVQLRVVASGHGLGLVPRCVLKASTLRDELSVVEVTDFSLLLDAWLVHGRQPGNLRKALAALAVTVSSRME